MPNSLESPRLARSRGQSLCPLDRAGVLTCKPNQKNPRDLDITLDYEFTGKNSSCSRTQSFRMR